MSIRTEIPNSEVIPVIESRIFEQNPEARFAAGVLAVNDQVKLGLDNEYAGYYDLRKKVYVEQTGQLGHEDLHEDGTDRDIDDTRSIAFGIVENRGFDQRVVASMRLITKGYDRISGTAFEGDRRLPVEDFCPELFDKNPTPPMSIEVSRLIARHEKAAMQDFLSWKIYSIALAEIANRQLGPTYAVVEPWFISHANMSGIPVQQLAPARYIEHYKAENLPIQVDTDAFIDGINDRDPGLMEELQAADGAITYFGKLRTPKAAA